VYLGGRGNVRIFNAEASGNNILTTVLQRVELRDEKKSMHSAGTFSFDSGKYV
jgi:hypothetical protein